MSKNLTRATFLPNLSIIWKNSPDSRQWQSLPPFPQSARSALGFKLTGKPTRRGRYWQKSLQPAL